MFHEDVHVKYDEMFWEHFVLIHLLCVKSWEKVINIY